MDSTEIWLNSKVRFRAPHTVDSRYLEFGYRE